MLNESLESGYFASFTIVRRKLVTKGRSEISFFSSCNQQSCMTAPCLEQITCRGKLWDIWHETHLACSRLFQLGHFQLWKGSSVAFQRCLIKYKYTRNCNQKTEEYFDEPQPATTPSVTPASLRDLYLLIYHPCTYCTHSTAYTDLVWSC